MCRTVGKASGSGLPPARWQARCAHRCRTGVGAAPRVRLYPLARDFAPRMRASLHHSETLRNIKDMVQTIQTRYGPDGRKTVAFASFPPPIGGEG